MAPAKVDLAQETVEESWGVVGQMAVLLVNTREEAMALVVLAKGAVDSRVLKGLHLPERSPRHPGGNVVSI
jgi:hypothetical protein